MTLTVNIGGRLYGQAAEVIPGQLYFASFEEIPKDDQYRIHVRVADYVHYDAFYDDFGPLNLSVLYRFCEALDALLKSKEKRKIVIVSTSADDKERVNAAYLVASYMVVYHGLSADQAYLRLKAAEPPSYVGFRDAAMGPPSYLLHLHPVIKSVERALKFKWLKFADFDPDEYEFYERVENGDFNWIIPGKILSFCGPKDRSYVENGYPYHAPEVYFDYFRSHNITTIIRLNKKIYDAKRFIDAGFEHKDLFFIDGSTPSDEIVLKFIEIVDNARGGVAIHCKAGLGRTGTLIACWMMKQYRLTATECMGWLRICRPGSVIGPQQHFLIEKQAWSWKLGSKSPPQTVRQFNCRIPNNQNNNQAKVLVTRLADELDVCDLRDVKNMSERQRNNLRAGVCTLPTIPDETALNEFGQSQGDRLLEMKARSQHQHPVHPPPVVLPSTITLPRFSSMTTPIKQLKLSNTRTTQNSTTEKPVIKSPACRNLNLNNIPISKVTVTSTHRPPILRNNLNNRKHLNSRNKPYPPAHSKPELSRFNAQNNNNIQPVAKYELRPRKNIQIPIRFDPARTLMPNASALLPQRRLSGNDR